MLHRHVFLRLSDGGDTVNGIPSLWISYTCFPYVFFFSSYWRWIFGENFPRQICLLRILLFETFIHVMLVLLLLVSEVFWSTALMLSACLIQDNKTLFGYVKRKKCFFFFLLFWFAVYMFMCLWWTKRETAYCMELFSLSIFSPSFVFLLKCKPSEVSEFWILKISALWSSDSWCCLSFGFD